MTQRESILQSKLLFKRSEIKPAVPKIVNTSKKELELQHSLHENDFELTNELVKKASILKNNSINFSHILSQDQVLQNVSAKLENQSLKLSKESSKISKLTSSSWTTTLLIWGSVLVVVLTFIGTFIFMRVFRSKNNLDISK